MDNSEITIRKPKAASEFKACQNLGHWVLSFVCNLCIGICDLLEFGTFSGFWAVFSGSSRRESNFVVSKTCFCDPRDFSDDKFENLPNSSDLAFSALLILLKPHNSPSRSSQNSPPPDSPLLPKPHRYLSGKLNPAYFPA